MDATMAQGDSNGGGRCLSAAHWSADHPEPVAALLVQRGEIEEFGEPFHRQGLARTELCEVCPN